MFISNINNNYQTKILLIIVIFHHVLLFIDALLRIFRTSQQIPFPNKGVCPKVFGYFIGRFALTFLGRPIRTSQQNQ